MNQTTQRDMAVARERLEMRTVFILIYLSSGAWAAPAVIFAQAGDGPPRAAHVEARRGETVRLFAAVKHKRQWYSDAPELRVRQRRITPRPLADLGGVAITWSLVEPRQHHVDTPPPNFGNPAYSNSVLFGTQHGKWLGYDTLEYTATPLAPKASTLSVTRATPTEPRLAVNGGLGTMRYAVRVTSDAGTFESPGANAVQRGGVRESVRRVSFRAGDDAVGWLTSFFNVPNVFGSAGRGRHHQTDRHQGADCADVLVGAWRKAGVKMPYTSVAGLYRYADVVTPKLLSLPEGLFEIDGDARGPAAAYAFGTDVRRGDIVVIDYGLMVGTGRTWDHIGMVGDDRGTIGAWDAEDGLLHMGYLYGLEHTPLRAQGPAVIQVLRLKPRLTRRTRLRDAG